MMDKILSFLPGNLVFICTALAFLVPYLIYKSNRGLHTYGDPPWKNEEKGVDEGGVNEKS